MSSSINQHLDYAGGVATPSHPPSFWSKIPGRDMTIIQRLHNLFNKISNVVCFRLVARRTTHLLGNNLPLTWIWDVPQSSLGSRQLQ